MSTTIIGALAQFNEAVARRIDDLYVEHGYAYEMPDGTDVPDEDQMRSTVFNLVSGAYASGKDDKSKVGLTKGELYARTFPSGPGAKPGTADELDEIDGEVRKALMRRVWNLVKDTPDGYVQKRLDGNVLIRSQVVRDRDLVPGVFVTDDPQLLLEESLMPGIEALVRRADRLREHATMLVSRQPALEQKVVGALAAGAKRANSVARLSIGSGTES
jgi:hypothetical protein